MYRYRKNYKKYEPNPQVEPCPFCHLGDREIIDQVDKALVIRSVFPYDLWEFRDVTDHLLIIPKRHVPKLSSLTAEEKADIIDLMAKYEQQGYNVYGRSERSVSKSVPGHQHTHLISTTDKKAKLAFFILKPYWLFKR